MARPTSIHVCSACGHETPRWAGQCPGCGDWNTLVEEVRTGSASAARPRRGGARVAARRAGAAAERRRRGTRSHEHGHRRARQRARGRDRPRVAGADRRSAGDRQVDADDDGAGEPGRRRSADSVRVGRGVGRPDPSAGGAAERDGGARDPGDRRDRPPHGAGDAGSRAARGLRGRLRADDPQRRAVERRRLGGPGPRGRRRDHARGQGAADRGAARRVT